jgi:hypothetical protein
VKLAAALSVSCPTCHAGAGQPCRSYRDIRLHRARSEAAQAAAPAQRQTILVGTTGAENVIPETAEYWPPWEPPPVAGCLSESGIPVSGLVWCPVHEEYEELLDGIPAARLRG